tara:strand:- start:391 stop:624 length:234 start_codon:yes stop_codon:yes gene_type:complete
MTKTREQLSVDAKTLRIAVALHTKLVVRESLRVWAEARSEVEALDEDFAEAVVGLVKAEARVNRIEAEIAQLEKDND